MRPHRSWWRCRKRAGGIAEPAVGPAEGELAQPQVGAAAPGFDAYRRAALHPIILNIGAERGLAKLARLGNADIVGLGVGAGIAADGRHGFGDGHRRLVRCAEGEAAGRP